MTADRPSAVIVLAAGGGTRMRSSVPKMLHRIGGRSLVGHCLTAARQAEPEHLVVVVRHQRDQVVEEVAAVDPAAVVADQDDVYGTGRAAECGLQVLPDDLEGTVVVTMSDTPLLSGQTLRDLARAREQSGAAATVLSAHVDDPTGYGRIVRGEGGEFLGVVEHKDATDDQRRITEINSGLWAFDAALLREALTRVGTDNAAGEKYLTDVPAILREQGHVASVHLVTDPWETEGVNTRVQLARLGQELNRRTVERWMLAGVTVVDPGSTWIDVDVELAEDVTLLPGTQLHGATRVETGAVVGPDTTLTDVEVGEGAQVIRTHGSRAVVRDHATVGPFAYLRPGTDLGARGKIGTFVETKNAQIGEGSKIPHLSYVGDATIGVASNIGAASVFVNYDGVAKHHTTIGSHCRMGSDNMYVAPVTVGDGAYSGASTTVRTDVPPGALAVSGGPQRNIEGWVARKRPGTPAAEAAARALGEESDQ